MNETELKPCPFCGGEVKVYTESCAYANGGRDYFYPSCKSEGCPGVMVPDDEFRFNTIMAETEKEAISIWNKRVCPKEVKKAVERDKPKKPDNVMKKDGLLIGLCKACRTPIDNGHRFCRICGQKLNWSDYA